MPVTPDSIVEFVRSVYQTNEFIPLHVPTFNGNEKEYLKQTIDSTFVSSVGAFVSEFEDNVKKFTGTPKAIATVNGTAALHTALYLADVQRGDLVITQALTFVATCNVLYHMGVEPIFLDVSSKSLGLCPIAVERYLEENAEQTDDGCVHKRTRKKIKAIVPMHTFGHPVEMDELISVCKKWGIIIIEDAAESLGSYYKGNHTGTIGEYGVLSFNGNKVITTGGGGMVLCRSSENGVRAKHITTTAKLAHPYEFYHDEPGFNYRLPNLNAALGCAQMESLEELLKRKRALAIHYSEFFQETNYKFVSEPDYAKSNYWLNAVICEDKSSRDLLLEETNSKGVMTRPVWTLMHRLPMYENAHRDDLTNSLYFEERVVNLPSTPIGACE